MSLLIKFWEKSPKAIWQALKNKVLTTNIHPQWVVVRDGPLKGGKLFLSVDAFGGWGDMIAGRFDAFIYDEVGRGGNIDGRVFWDIGAHFGYHSFSFASLIGNSGHVYSFEPNPFNLRRFRVHLEGNPELSERITVNNFALSDVDGEMSFMFSDDVDGSLSSGGYLSDVNAPLDRSAYMSFKTQLVPTFTIDSCIRGSGIRIPDIIKIDVEGAELLVLKGGENFFRIHKPKIFMEVHNISMMYYVHDFLLRRGYSVRILDEKNSTVSKCFIMAQAR